MAKFLTQEEIYRLIQRELPQDVYSTGAPSAFFTTADDDSVARTIAMAYENANRIYDNYFPSFTLERISDWEVTVFGSVGSGLKSVDTRRQDVLDKLQDDAGISVPIITDKVRRTFLKADLISEDNTVSTPDWLLDFGQLEVDTYLGFRDPAVPFTSLSFEIVAWTDAHAAWLLDYSALDVETYLSTLDPGRGVGLDCGLDGAPYGLTPDQVAEIQQTAYTYEVRITGHAEQIFLDYLDAQLDRIEPARSTHVIINDFPGPVAP